MVIEVGRPMDNFYFHTILFEQWIDFFLKYLKGKEDYLEEKHNNKGHNSSIKLKISRFWKTFLENI